MQLPGLGTGQPHRNIPAMRGGWQRHPGSPQPATLLASCPHRNAAPGRRRDTDRQTDGQLPAAGCSTQGTGGRVEVGTVPPASPMGSGFHHPLTQGWDAPVSTLTQPRKKGEMSCLLPFSESRSLYKDEHKQGFHPRPDIALSQGILGL